MVPPACRGVVAQPVALKAGVGSAFPLPRGTEGFVAGAADDGAGVQALVAGVGGTTRRPDGSTCHAACSQAPGRRAVEGNGAVRGHGRTPVPGPRRIRTEPAVFS
jgi:hypothetical protein